MEHYSENQFSHTNMSVSGNTEKIGVAQQHTDSTKLSVPDWNQIYNALVSILLNQRIISPCQSGI